MIWCFIEIFLSWTILRFKFIPLSEIPLKLVTLFSKYTARTANLWFSYSSDVHISKICTFALSFRLINYWGPYSYWCELVYHIVYYNVHILNCKTPGVTSRELPLPLKHLMVWLGYLLRYHFLDTLIRWFLLKNSKVCLIFSFRKWKKTLLHVYSWWILLEILLFLDLLNLLVKTAEFWHL